MPTELMTMSAIANARRGLVSICSEEVVTSASVLLVSHTHPYRHFAADTCLNTTCQLVDIRYQPAIRTRTLSSRRRERPILDFGETADSDSASFSTRHSSAVTVWRSVDADSRHNLMYWIGFSHGAG